MTRRTLLRIHLKLTDRWAVGGVADPWSQIPQPVLVDPRRDIAGGGQAAYLPMTSLAGSLAAHLGKDAEYWLGPRPGEREKKPEKPTAPVASKLALWGSVGLDAAAVSQRGSTAIDGRRGAATANTFRDEQWTTPVDVVVVGGHDGPVRDDLLDQLAQWRPFVGRARSSGLGAAAVTLVEAMAVDLTTEPELGWWLTEREAWLSDSAAAPGWATVKTRAGWDGATSLTAASEVVWEVCEPVHVGDGRYEGLPGAGGVAKAVSSSGTLFVPGSSWKGVFRHRVEAILAVAGADEETTSQITGKLFGDLKQGRGLLWFGDSRAQTSAPLTRTHVAIDRFTGGAREGALYQIESMPPCQQLTLRIHPPREALPGAVDTLIRHVVRDIHEGLVGIGGNGSRGYGTIRLKSPELVAELDPVNLVDLAGLLATTSEATPSDGLGTDDGAKVENP